jgi:hypothetical protein
MDSFIVFIIVISSCSIGASAGYIWQSLMDASSDYGSRYSSAVRSNRSRIGDMYKDSYNA